MAIQTSAQLLRRIILAEDDVRESRTLLLALPHDAHVFASVHRRPLRTAQVIALRV
jgi:hypothetical protein